MTSGVCDHCALPLGGGAVHPPEGGDFCCTGCARVYALLQREGLGDYYRLKDAFSDRVAPTPVPEVARDTDSFAHLDDPEVLARIGAPGQARLQLTGLSCPACVWLIERLPDRIDGLESARVDLSRGHVDLRWDPARRRLSEVAATLSELGYDAHVEEAHAQRARERDRRRELVRLAVAGACAGNVMLIGFGLHAGSLQGIEDQYARFLEWAAMLIAFPAVTYGAWPFYRGVGTALRMGRLHLDLPISLGVIGSYLASVLSTLGLAGVGRSQGAFGSYYDSVTALVFLLLVGRWIQHRSQRWATSRWNLMQRLLPQSARRRTVSGEFESVPLSRLAVGDIVEVRAGEALPADARVCEGGGQIDSAALTGESRRRPVEVGAEVLAGSQLAEGHLILELLRVGEATRIGRLAGEIAGAREGRAPLQRSVDRISGAFAATVVLVASVAGLVWWQLDPSRVFDIVVSVLVISCPCALGLATPMALLVARARAAERGFSIADDATLERIAGVRHVVFDKTGTLTEGRSEVRLHAPELEAHAALVLALEAGVRHPLAAALRDWANSYADADASRLVTVETPTVHPGRGVEGWVDGRRIRIGRPDWMPTTLDDRLAARVERGLAAGLSPIAMAIDDRCVGVWGVGDPIRADARPALRALEGLGLEVSIASGDHPAVAELVGAQLGVAARGGMSPEEKIAYIRAHAPAAMVGDGINDAAAMRAAEVGIAVDRAVDVAASVADVRQLQRQGVFALPELFAGARATMRLVRRNLGVSLTYNVAFGAAAVLGWVDPLVAAIGMPISSVTVIVLSSVGGGFRGRGVARAPQNLPSSPAAFTGGEVLAEAQEA